MISKPLLSICIPTYNRADWLRASLSLLLPQTALLPDRVEVIVSDNCSTDNTKEVVEAAQAIGPVRYNRNETNIGGEPNFYRLAGELAQGEYTWLVGDDDFVRDGAVSAILDVLTAYPSLDYVFVNYQVWPCSQAPAPHFRLPDITAPELLSSNKGLSDRLVPHLSEVVRNDFNCFTPISCSVMRRGMAAEAIFRDPYPAPFTSPDSNTPLPMYIARNLLKKPAWYFGTPLTVLGTSNTWSQYTPAFMLNIMPALYDLFEEYGVPAADITVLRRRALSDMARPLHAMLFEPKTPHRDKFSLRRFLQQNRKVKGAPLLLALDLVLTSRAASRFRAARFASHRLYLLRRRIGHL